MKRVFVVTMLAAGLLSCAKENLVPQDENTEPAAIPVCFNINVAETKAAKTDWAEGDVIYVFFKGLESKYLILTRSSSGWTETAGAGDFELADFFPLSEQMLTAVHFPVAVDVSYDSGNKKFSFTSGGTPVYNYYLFDSGKAYDFDDSTTPVTVVATLEMGKPADMVQVHVAGIEASVATYTFGCSLIRPVACTDVKLDGSLTEDVLQPGARLSGFADADGAIFAGRLESPGVAANYKFTLASDSQIYTLTRPDRTLNAGKMYNFPPLSVTGDNYWTVTEASSLYVDLGLPSGTKWAKYNLGAAAETDYGDYFAWGELQPKNYYNRDFSTYLWGVPGDFIKYTGFSGTDYSVLQKEDDAAYAALGGKFRMPTRAEIIELLATKSNTTDYTWVMYNGFEDKYNGSSVAGWMVRRNVSGATIFFPCAGGMADFWLVSAGSIGYYWSSSLYVDAPENAWGVDFYSQKQIGECDEGGDERFIGRSVRPVSD